MAKRHGGGIPKGIYGLEASGKGDMLAVLRVAEGHPWVEVILPTRFAGSSAT